MQALRVETLNAEPAHAQRAHVTERHRQTGWVLFFNSHFGLHGFGHRDPKFG
jgi:hypothetical protein